MIESPLRITLYLLLLATVPGCKVARRPLSLTPPIVTLEFENLTDPERRVLVQFMEQTAARQWRVEAGENPATPGATLSYQVHLHRWSDQEILHAQLVNLRATPDNHLILQNHQTRSALAYTSSQAQSQSMALVTISVAPPSAQLYFDTRVPRATATPASMTQDGRYQVQLPFSFIKAYDNLYFHSVFKGQYRYYRYNLKAERQELLPGVDSPEAMTQYLLRQSRSRKR